MGRLVAIEPVERRSNGSVMWHCKRDCGMESVHSINALRSGRVNSCGYLKRENDARKRSLHYVDNTCIEDTRKLRSDNTSGCRGLKLVRDKWQVRIGFKKKSYYLGQYSDKEEAFACAGRRKWPSTANSWTGTQSSSRSGRLGNR